jgi:hypothetical protein
MAKKTTSKVASNVPQGSWETEEEIADVDLGQFEKQCKELFDLDAKIEVEESKVKELKAQAEVMKDSVMAIMKKYKKDKYPVTGCGTIKISKKWSWKIPQNMEAKEKFFKFLKKKGIFMELVSVNSQTLNSFCKAELEIAKQRGDVDWNPDGLEAPNMIEKIQLSSK